jgi:glycine/D-amino acid oxidase-like deaminating enzyme
MRPDWLDDNSSCWIAELGGYTPLPALRGDQHADVAIVGGGLTGVSTAWHLSQRFPDRRIILLEAGALANGASGRNGGQVLNWINGVDSADAQQARRIFDVTHGGIDLVAELVSRYRLDAGFARTGALEVYTSAATAEAAHARVERLRAVGIPLEWVPADGAALRGAHGAVADPTAARVNGAGLVRGLRPILLERGVAVYEHTAVERIEQATPLRLFTAGGEVRARAAVLATNAYTPALGYFRHQILPLHSHVVATAPLPAEDWRALGWGAWHGFADDLDRIAYGCRTAAGRLLFGGGGNDAYAYRYGGSPVFRDSPERAAASFVAIERRLRNYFPALRAPIVHRWTGTLDVTFDRVCSMGVTGRDANLYYAIGYSGHGLALAMLAGRVLCDLYSGHHDPWRDLPFYQRHLHRLPPEPLRWLGYHAYTWATGRSPRRR